MKQKVIFLAGFVLLISQIANAQLGCISGSAGGMNLINQLEEAKKSSPITQIISAQYNLNSQKTEACVSGLCETKTGSLPASDQLKSIQKAILPSGASTTALVFKKECLIVSNTFRASTPQIECPSGN